MKSTLMETHFANEKRRLNYALKTANLCSEASDLVKGTDTLTVVGEDMESTVEELATHHELHIF